MRNDAPDTDLATAFREAFTAVAGVPHAAASIEEAADCVLEILRGANATLIAMAQLSDDLAAAIEQRCAAANIRVLKPPFPAAELPNLIDPVQVGITGLEFGIAESGTMVEVALNDAVRLVSAMPRTYIGIMRASTIVPRLMDAAPKLREHFLANDKHVTVSFISGPSRTGDIEMILTLGVHGPEHAHCILLQETEAG